MTKDDIIEQQFRFIDDIDTYQDVAKGNTEVFYKLVTKRLHKYLKETPIHSKDGQTLNIEEIHKNCIFEKFKKSECDIVCMNKTTGAVWCQSDNDMELCESIFNNDNIFIYPIPRWATDSEAVSVFLK